MKKIILLLMMVFTLVLLAACGKEDPGYNDEPYGDPSDIINTPDITPVLEFNAAEAVDITADISATDSGDMMIMQTGPTDFSPYAISVGIPDGWLYSIIGAEHDGVSTFGVEIYPDIPDIEGAVVVEYTNYVGVRGTALNERSVLINGMEGIQGFSGSENDWEYIVLCNDFEGCAILNNGSTWAGEYSDTINKILSTIQFIFFGKNDNTGFGDNEIVGNDWRTWKPYGIAKRESNGVTEDIYIEAFSDDGIVHLLKDSGAYNVIQSIQTRHGSISDIYYLQATAYFKDVNGDGNEDLVLSDPVGGDIITEVFLYDDIVCEYVYSEAESKNASQQ